ncbi:MULTISPECIES: 5-carboxymethyl-2-hydroxymuconate Delta-isomerase [Streptomyces]|uniref:5-carboxymethyl-2-hydroxymuconate Delta-isomerase n=1 Tax=Streptomyces TaxID=1883 RepID=UPI00163CDD9A|nr:MULTISPECIES: isomerase [Streptomyces]MBC2876206.1 isomerase [Streptomyces sp. TYQ1024]UBI35569.1 isomerase [Streptomyces mobaraensis]UKW28164.1 isomerase [Streptomyces sp. TYQ1024]
MPHFAVDYSASLAGAFDRRAFALALHPLTARVLDTAATNCKTRFRRCEEVVVADGLPGQSLVHVEVAVLPGRTDEAKAALSEAVLALVREHTAGAEGVVHASVNVGELSASYRRHIGAAGA